MLTACTLGTARVHQHGITFRTWREGEPVSPHPAASGLGRTFSDECPAAESQLLLKDLWQAGYTRVWMNPRVKVSTSPTAVVWVTAVACASPSRRDMLL